MDRREFIHASGALAFGCSRISDAFSQTSWTPPYALPARGQVISLSGPGSNTLRAVATAANGWGDYSSMTSLANPIWNGFGFGAFAADYGDAGAMVIAGNGGHHAGGIWGGFIFDFTTGQWISKANTNGKIETRADPGYLTIDWSTGELKDKTGLTGQLPVPGHGYLWPFCPPKSVSGGTKGVYIKPCVAAGSDAGYDASRSFQFDLDTGLWTYASDNNMNFDGAYLNPYTSGGGDWDPVTNRYYTPQKGYATGALRYLDKTASGWTWRKVACPNLRNATLTTVFVNGRELVLGYADFAWQKIDLDNIGAGASYFNMLNPELLAASFRTRWHKYPVDGCWYALNGKADRAAITSWAGDSSPPGTLAADQSLLKIDPATWTVTREPIAGGILALWENRYTATPSHGNAFVYVPKLQCFAWFPRPDTAVQLIKPSAGGTPAPDTQPPTVPANLRTSTTTTSSITWAWDASVDNGGGAVAGYKVALYDGGGMPLGSVVDAGNVLTYTASGLAASTTYKLAASAYDNAAPANESAFSAQVAGATAAVPDTQPPTVPTNLRVTSATANSISWVWDASTDSGGTVAGYKVALQDAAGAPIGAVVDKGNVLTHTASGLAAGTTYRLTVSAYDNATPPNASDMSAPVAGTTSTVSSDTQPPTVPTTLRVKKVTTNSITWTWNASTDLGGGSVAGYKVALVDTSGAPIVGPVNVGNVLTYTANGLLADSTYRLTVSAYDTAVPVNESAPCAPVAGTTRKAPPGQS